ncbi:OLC1v1034427C1 [Oldenlandia corymbosa var. corymbosa]|uniref:OLC1v1034427C1 n=1 Tax=Oldenlandia corymbosa var. corymbosa TaxID=529605 RepID=A0AAV1CRW1_OLDCO|nr:OLC1v1034427C1 [Oldenlandia corymbosa var. corymbosa]
MDGKLASCSLSGTTKLNSDPGGTVDLPNVVPKDFDLKGNPEGGSNHVNVPVDQGASGTSSVPLSTPEGAIQRSHPYLDTSPPPPKVQIEENRPIICPNPITVTDKGLEVYSCLSDAVSEIQSRLSRYKEQGRSTGEGVIELASKLQEMETQQNEALKMSAEDRLQHTIFFVVKEPNYRIVVLEEDSLIDTKRQEEEIQRLKYSIEGARAVVQYWEDSQAESFKKVVDIYTQYFKLQTYVTKLRSRSEELEAQFEQLSRDRQSKELEAQVEQLSRDRCFLMVEGIPMAASKLLQSDEVHEIL